MRNRKELELAVKLYQEGMGLQAIAVKLKLNIPQLKKYLGRGTSKTVVDTEELDEYDEEATSWKNNPLWRPPLSEYDGLLARLKAGLR